MRSAHASLVVAPLGLWWGAAVLDVASRLGPEPAVLVRTATWLTGFGMLTAVAAGVAGMAAGAPIPVGTAAHRWALLHLLSVVTTLAFFGFAFVHRLSLMIGPPASFATVGLSVSGALLASITGVLGRRVSRTRR